MAWTVSTLVLPRTIRWRVRRQTCARPGQDGARCSAIVVVASSRRVSIRLWLFSIVVAARRSGGGDQAAQGGIRPEGQTNVCFQRRLVVLHGEEIVATAVGDGAADLFLGEDGIAGDDHAIERQRLEQLQRGGDLVGVRRHRQLADHTLQGYAERRQQMNAAGLCRGTAAEPLSINRNMARGLVAADPTAQGPLQRRDIQSLEHLAPYRRGRNTSAVDADGGKCFEVQPPSPTDDAQLVAPACQQRGDRDQQEAGQRVTPARRAAVIRDRDQCVPKAACLRCGRRHSPSPRADSGNDQNRIRTTPLPSELQRDVRTESPCVYCAVWSRGSSISAKIDRRVSIE